jgi:para-nitrobenzyl esterase
VVDPELDAPVVTCPAGTLRGLTGGGVSRFLGIPYALPPIGARRFAPAEPMTGWEGTLDASRFGPASAQVFDPKEAAFEEFGEASPEPGRLWVGSEDSLTLNIWRAEGGGSARPVIIWIHGGANWLESSRLGFYDGTALAKDGVVFVSLNYRLGVFGFLDLSPIGGPDQAHSHGLTDQKAAIDWVVANIAAFGGDPGNITLMGNSAGSIDISWHIASGRLPGGVRRVIMSSGVGSASGLGWDGTASAHDPAEGHARATAFLRNLGYASFADLQAATTGEILTRQAEATKPAIGLPETDTLFYPRTGTYSARNPFAAVASGAGRGLDLMIGFTAYEMGLWLLWDDEMDRRSAEWAADHVPFVPSEARARLPDLYRQWLPEASEGQRAMHMIGDVVFALPSLWFADLMAEQGVRVHVWRFDWQADPRLGALHAADIAFFLGVQDATAAEGMIGAATDDADRTARQALAETMMHTITSFATTGSPQIGGASWPAYSPARREVMLFDSVSHSVPDPLGPRRAWWTENVLSLALQSGAAG